ncbi:uncharacterized protein LOC122059059 [Macadamia integrifolia]|uniref:uncharacterized protein LOC122059059 n=1 Tax=Macadamia integrifolia TaxID=60698 RepID=UPI001C532049|nr:uncharacterized protein LOC122059059 [Macadamia integrifolia]
MIRLLGMLITFRFILLYSLLAVLHGPCGADPPYPYCSNVTTSSSLFQYNLNDLFSHLSSNASLSIFKNSTTGNETDTVYGLFLCLGFDTLDKCKICVDTAIQDIKKLCPNNEEATVWEEYCQLRYSNKSFFGYTDDAGNLPLWNRKNISDPNQFSQVVRELLNSLSRSASFDPSTGLYATGKANLSINEKVYGLVQCTRDLSGNDCLKCLQDATNEILSCCYFYRGARLLSKSCYLRYELYAFYEGATEALPPPPPPSTGDHKKKISTKILIITTVSACVAVAFLGSFVYCLVAKGRKEITFPETSTHQNNTIFPNYVVQGAEEMEPHDIPLFRLDIIHSITDNFSDSKKLGEGGFGPVFKGTLTDGREVAIKRLSISSEQGSEEFMNEVMLIMRLQHKNLVRLLGCCIEGGEKILIYEYMHNSSLDVVLRDSRTRAQLHWRRRFNIIVGIARGILYLHEDSRLKIIHRDLKPSNVLLDQEMNPKISDFGIARIFCGRNGEKNTGRIVGTFGYMAPEFAMDGVYSTKSDVFSFGVILLEIVTGTRNAGFHRSKHAPSLLEYAWQLWCEGRGLELMDPFLAETYCPSEFLRCINVGLLCVQEDAIDRPNMSNVVVMLRSESLPLPHPQKPPFSVGRATPIIIDELSINWLTISGITPLHNELFKSIPEEVNGEMLLWMRLSSSACIQILGVPGFASTKNISSRKRKTADCEAFPLLFTQFHILHYCRILGKKYKHLVGMSKTFHFILLYSLLALLHSPCGADAPYPFCSNTTANNTVNTLFKSNLNQLFSSLSSSSSLSKFSNYTIGNKTERVYGLFLCLGFDTMVQCKNCVDMAVQDITRLCPYGDEATVWEEYCLLRYSSQNFFGHTDYTRYLPLWNNKTISNPNQFSLVVRELLNNLSNSAILDPSTGLYATGQTNLTSDQKVYGLVQCTRDLSGNDCLQCLRNATDEIISCCYFYRGARLLTKSCYLRYELYAFYEGATEALPTPPSSSEADDQNKKISTKILSITVVSACVAVALLGISVYCLVAKGRKEITVPETPLGSPNSTDLLNYFGPGSEEMEPHDIPTFNLATIHATTDNFSDSKKLGQGGFGLVFKGTLPDGREVAIKRLSSSSDQGSEEFMNEALLIMRLQHKNLVRLLGCCIEDGEKILVYEYMPNGSLDGVLFDPRTRATFDWRRRFNIIVGIARGILYLHEDSRLRIIHRDLKPSNVLLDQDVNPKISDFGMARIFGGSDGEKNTARIVGTYGYMAPEFAMEGVYSTMSDVYSFGVILLEIVTGRRNAGFHRSKHASSLLDYAWQLWSKERGLELMDPLLTETYCSNEFLRCINVGLLCVQEDAIYRPTMSNVVVMLRSESLSLPQPQKPAFSVGQVAPMMIDDFSVNWLTVTPR